MRVRPSVRPVAILVAVAALALSGLAVRPAPVEAVVPGPEGPIVFDRDLAGGFDIFSIRPDGTSEIRLTNGNHTFWQSPTWSPDGSKVAYQIALTFTGIWAMNADGTAPTTIFSDPALLPHYPTWSPDGTKIAFNLYHDAGGGQTQREIYVVNTDGTGQPQRLTNNPANDSDPVWSPDGTEIAFASDRPELWDVFVMNADGTNPTNVSMSLTTNDFDPAWSPDGTEIAFTSDRDGQGEVYTMEADGDHQTNRTNNAAGDGMPAWSPDGSEIAFSSDRDGDDEIFAMRPDGTSPRQLTFNTVNDWNPDWGVPCGHRFVDVPLWVQGAVDWAACNGHMTGFGLEFAPTGRMTRAQAARLLYRINGSPDVSTLPEHGFADVPPWVEDPVRWMAAHSIATGYPTDPPTFRPDAPITRGEYTRMQHRVADPPPASSPNSFSDVPPWLADAVDWIADPTHDVPYATGWPDGTYRPENQVTRAEATRMTCRILGTAVC